MLGIDPIELRRRNFYREGQTTPYGQTVKDAARLPAIWGQLHAESDIDARRARIEVFNAEHAGSRHR